MKRLRRYRWSDFFRKAPDQGSAQGPSPRKPFRMKERVSVGWTDVVGNRHLLELRNASGQSGFVDFPENTVLVVKETPWLK